MRHHQFLLTGMLLALFAVQSSQAAVVSYDNYSDWINALGGGPATVFEDFNGEAPQVGTPIDLGPMRVTGANTAFIASAGGPDVDIDGTDYLGFTLIQSISTNKFRFDDPMMALGFYMRTSAANFGDEMRITPDNGSNATFTLPNNSQSHFYGFIWDTLSEDFEFKSRDGAIGVTIDNVSAMVPVPAAAWMALPLLGVIGINRWRKCS